MLQPSWMDCVPDMSPVVVVELQVYSTVQGKLGAPTPPEVQVGLYSRGQQLQLTRGHSRR